MFNTNFIKKDFPIFRYHPHLVYLDSAATSLKPQSVIDKITEYYSQYSVNIHRGTYQLSEKATQEYEETRQVVADFIGAKNASEIIFTRNATESLNLIAYALGRQIISKNDEIVTTIMEHHSNFVPWKILASETGAVFKVIDIEANGELKIKNVPRSGIPAYHRRRDPASRDGVAPQTASRLAVICDPLCGKKLVPSEAEGSKIALDNIITKKTKILALTYVSNVLGTVNPVKDIIHTAREINPSIIIIVDATKAASHLPINVQEMDCDFLVFSAHKMLGPTGVGILWGKIEYLNSMYPFNYGGGMIQEVSIEKTVFKNAPDKFEAGTPDIAGVIAFKSAIKYILKLGIDKIQRHQQAIALYALKRLKEEFNNEITIYGSQAPPHLSGIISFNFKNYHPHDVAQILDEDTIAIRAGHHCAMPLHKRLGIPATARASFYIYNDEEDVDQLITGLKKVKTTLR